MDYYGALKFGALMVGTDFVYTYGASAVLDMCSGPMCDRFKGALENKKSASMESAIYIFVLGAATKLIYDMYM